MRRSASVPRVSRSRQGPRTTRHIAAAERLETRRLLALSAAITVLDGNSYLAESSVTILQGQALHVDAVGNLSGAGASTYGTTNGPLDTHFTWNFGDSSAQSQYNILPGFNAAHVYNATGTYTVTLTLAEGSATSTATVSVTVNAPTVTTYYVASTSDGGNSANSGTQASPWDLGTGLSHLGSNVTLLFKSGDTFPFTYPVNFYSGTSPFSNVTIGSYGSGSLPIFTTSTAIGDYFGGSPLTTGPMSNINIEDINFTSSSLTGASKPGVLVTGWSDNVIVQNCQFGYLGYVITGDGGTNGSNGLLVEGDTELGAPSSTPQVYGSVVYSSGSDNVIMGNLLTGAENENELRIDGGNPSGGTVPRGTLVYGNQGWQYLNKTVLNFRWSIYSEVSHNYFDATTGGSSTIGLNLRTASTSVQYDVIEDNWLYDTKIDISYGVDHVVVRNNNFYQINQNAIEVGDTQDSAWFTTSDDLQILNNSCYSTSTVGAAFLVVDAALDSTPQLTLENNVYDRPLITSTANLCDILIKPTTAADFKAVGGNLWEQAYSSGNDIELNNGASAESIGTWDSSSFIVSNGSITNYDVEQVSGTPNPAAHQIGQVSMDTAAVSELEAGYSFPTHFEPVILNSAAAIAWDSGAPSALVFDDIWGEARTQSYMTSGAQQYITKVGVYRSSNGTFYLDTSADGHWGNGDEAVTSFGTSNDIPVFGDWSGNGLDKVGVYRPSNGYFYLDTNGDGSWDSGDTAPPFASTTGVTTTSARPIVGRWNGGTQVEVGIFDPATNTFYLDYNGNGTWDGPAGGDKKFTFNPAPGDAIMPVAGDWTGSGSTKVGVFDQTTGWFYLDSNGDDSWGGSDVSFYFGHTGTAYQPVIGDFNGDGKADVGLFTYSYTTGGTFYLDTNANNQWDSGDSTVGSWGDPGDQGLIFF